MTIETEIVDEANWIFIYSQQCEIKTRVYILELNSGSRLVPNPFILSKEDKLQLLVYTLLV